MDFNDETVEPLLQTSAPRTRANSWAPMLSTDLPRPELGAVHIVAYAPDLDPFYTPPPHTLQQIALDRSLKNSITEKESPPSTPLFRSLKKLDLGKYMRSGSQRGSIFNLCSATLGAGALSIPSAFSDSGLVLGVILLIIGVAATIFSIQLLVDSRKYTGLYSLEEISVVCYGRKFGFFVEFNILVLCFGTLVAYIVAVGDIITPILQLTPLKDLSDSDARLVSMSFFWFFIMAPLSVLERINSLRFTSFLGVVAIFFLAIVTAITSIEQVVDNGFASSWERAQLFTMEPLSIVEAIPVIMFAFTCQINVIPIYNELEAHSTRRMNKVTLRSTFISFSVYIIMGTFGYLNFPLNTQPNILSNYCVNKTRNPLHLAAYGAILATIALAFPLSVFPLRYTLDLVLFRSHQKSEYSTSRKQILAFLVSGLALAVAIFTPSIKFVYSLIGGTTSVFCNFVLPVMLTLKLRRNRPGVHTLAVYTLGIATLICGIVSTVGTFYFQFFAPPTPLLQGDNCNV